MLFDLGGTLFDYADRDALRVPERRALRRCGIDPDDEQAVAARREAHARVERQFAAEPAFLHRDLFAARVREAARSLGVEPSAEVLQDFSDEMRTAIVGTLVARADAASTIQELRARGVTAGVVSNADDDYLEDVLRDSGLLDLLDHWTSSEGAWSCKPDQRIFQVAMAKTGCEPDEIAFVGDSPAHDVAGARAAGMRTILIGDGAIAPLSADLPADTRPDAVVQELSQIPRLGWFATTGGGA